MGGNRSGGKCPGGNVGVVNVRVVNVSVVNVSVVKVLGGKCPGTPENQLSSKGTNPLNFLLFLRETSSVESLFLKDRNRVPVLLF